MSILAIARNFDGNPNIVTIVTDDDLATITTTGYWTTSSIVADIEALQNGDFQWSATDLALICYAPADLINFFVFDAVNQTFIANPAAGGLTNTLASGDVFVGNASNIATGVALTGPVAVSNAGVTSLTANSVLSSAISPLLPKYTTVAITAAQFNGMYATPKLILAAGGANTLIVLHRAMLVMTFVSADYAAGGVVGFQYDSTAHGAGVAASNTEAAADFFAAASTTFQFEGVSGNTVAISPFTTSVNKGLYLSNLTQAFTTGDSTWVCHLWYSIIPTI